MRHLIPVLLVLAGCAAPTDLEGDLDGVGGKADGASLALEGTREGYGVLRLLNDGEGSDFVFLDDVVALDRRAATNLVAHRDGADGVFGTADDDLFDTIEEVDAVSWVGPSALETLSEFARLNDYLPGDDERLGRFDDVDFTYAEAERVLDFENVASEDELRGASVPSRAVTSIVEARPVATIAVLADLYWVGTRTLEHLLAAVAQPAGGEVCMSNDECGAGLRCVGRPWGHDYGKCRDVSHREGFQDICALDADCGDGLICIAQTVYGDGYCAHDWMRDSFTVGGVGSIPAVAMTEPTAHPVLVFGQATVPEDVIVDVDITHSDPSSLWIGLQPPTGQEPVTLWDGATMTGPLPARFIDRAVYRDDSVNGEWALLVQNVAGRGEGELRGFTLTVTSRWD